MSDMTHINAVGRRKKSVARAYMFTGEKGGITVNKKKVEDYFSDRGDLLKDIKKPLNLIGNGSSFKIKLNVKGGGKKGQAGAIRLAISRALAQLDEGTRRSLRKSGFLTRDARMVERKKPYRRKARKSEQYKKR